MVKQVVDNPQLRAQIDQIAEQAGTKAVTKGQEALKKYYEENKFFVNALGAAALFSVGAVIYSSLVPRTIYIRASDLEKKGVLRA